MIDHYGRNIDYIRISVTDRCNLRCVYCMPEEGVPLASHNDILSYQEIERVCGILANLGFRKVKLTGGEPLVRKDLVDLVRNIKRIDGIENVTLTSNGILLKDTMGELAEAGIDAVNISLDTMCPQVFQQITRRDGWKKVQEGIQAALAFPEIPLKINCVPLGIPGQDLLSVAALAQNNRIHVRFIEMMPIGYGKNYEYYSQAQIMADLERVYGPLTPAGETLGNGPGRYYTLQGFLGKIGFISAVSHKFCGECNRIRLTSLGYLKTCLQYETGEDLRALLRNGAPDSQLEAAIRRAILDKPREHHFMDGQIDREEAHTMSQIGG